MQLLVPPPLRRRQVAGVDVPAVVQRGRPVGGDAGCNIAFEMTGLFLLSQNPIDRSRLASARMVGSGTTILLLALVLAPQIKASDNLALSFLVTATIFLVVGTALFLITFLTARETVIRDVAQVSLKQTLQTVRQNGPLVRLCLSSFFYLTGQNVVSALGIYIANDVLRLRTCWTGCSTQPVPCRPCSSSSSSSSWPPTGSPRLDSRGFRDDRSDLDDPGRTRDGTATCRGPGTFRWPGRPRRHSESRSYGCHAPPRLPGPPAACSRRTRSH